MGRSDIQQGYVLSIDLGPSMTTSSRRIEKALRTAYPDYIRLELPSSWEIDNDEHCSGETKSQHLQSINRFAVLEVRSI